jgi:hypothetical protein
MAEETKTPKPAPKAAAAEAKPESKAPEAEPKVSADNPGGFTYQSSRENFQSMTALDHAEFVIKTITSVPMVAINSVAHAFKKQFGN